MEILSTSSRHIFTRLLGVKPQKITTRIFSTVTTSKIIFIVLYFFHIVTYIISNLRVVMSRQISVEDSCEIRQLTFGFCIGRGISWGSLDGY
jgi:hypothetical protein